MVLGLNYLIHQLVSVIQTFALKLWATNFTFLVVMLTIWATRTRKLCPGLKVNLLSALLSQLDGMVFQMNSGKWLEI